MGQALVRTGDDCIQYKLLHHLEVRRYWGLGSRMYVSCDYSYHFVVFRFYRKAVEYQIYEARFKAETGLAYSCPSHSGSAPILIN